MRRFMKGRGHCKSDCMIDSLDPNDLLIKIFLQLGGDFNLHLLESIYYTQLPTVIQIFHEN